MINIEAARMNRNASNASSVGAFVESLSFLPLIFACVASIGCIDQPRVEQPAPFVRSVGHFSVYSFSPTVVGDAWIRIELDPLESEVESTKDVTFVYHMVGAPQHSGRGVAVPVDNRGVYEMRLYFTEPGEWEIRFDARWPGGRYFSEGKIFMRVGSEQ